MIYQKTPPAKDSPYTKLVKGKSYIFENGEVSKEEDALSISVPPTGIIEQHRFLPSFVPGKMQRLGDVQKRENSNYFMEKAINLEDKPSSKK
jgi:hypothetical protein